MLQFYLVWLYIFVFFPCICGLLDFDELKSVDYGFSLLDTPVVRSEDALSGAMYMTSVHGQQYQCSFPAISEQKKKEKEDEQAAVETGISELLRPMQEGPCLIYNKGWWTYEFCYGKAIKQYHMEDQKVQGEIISLGQYASEFDWNNASDKRKNSLNRYHSQHYVNGSDCDLTGKPRKTEIRFMCEEGAGDHISRIDEPESCGYIFTVQTTKICHHPYLKPPTKSKPFPITCNPILSQAEYDEYQAEVAEERRAKEEAVVKYREKMQQEADELKKLQDKLKAKENELKESTKDESESGTDEEVTSAGEKTEGSNDLTTHAGVNKAMEQLQNLLSDTLAKGLQEAMDEYGIRDEYNMDNVEMTMRYVDDPADIKKVMNEMMKEQKAKLAGKGGEKKGIEGDSDISNDADNDEILGTGEDEMDTGESDEEKYVDIITGKEEMDVNSGSSENNAAEDQGEEASNLRINKYVVEDTPDKKSTYFEAKENTDDKKEEEEDEKEDAVVETEDEDQEAMDDFEKGLDKIAPTDQAKERLAKYKENLNSAMQAQFSDIVEEAQRELANEGEHIDIDKQETFQKMTDTLSKLLGKLDKSGEVKPEQVKDMTEDKVLAPVEEKDLKEDEAPQTPFDALDKVDNVQAGTDVADNRLEERKQRLEGTVKETLEKALNVNGRKVEVRIMTAVTDEDGTVHVMSETTDSSNLNKVVFALLGDNDDELREAQKQQQMEGAYNFQWSSKKGPGIPEVSTGGSQTVIESQEVPGGTEQVVEDTSEVVVEEVEP